MEVIQEFVDHIINFVEKPKLNGLPICPFAKKARVKNLILFHVMPLAYDSTLDWIVNNYCTAHEVMIIINDNKSTLSASDVESLAMQLNATLPSIGLQAFWGHPQALFCVDGVFTRREPYPNIQVIKKSIVEKAEKLLQATDYYEKWSQSNLDEVKLI